jgi:hypothetical protein
LLQLRLINLKNRAGIFVTLKLIVEKGVCIFFRLFFLCDITIQLLYQSTKNVNHFDYVFIMMDLCYFLATRVALICDEIM